MGKYDGVVQGLEKLPPEVRYASMGGVKYHEKVEAAKLADEFQDHTPTVLLTLYADLRRQAEEKEEEVKALNVRVEAAAQLLVEAYEMNSIDSLNVKKVGTLRTDYVPHTHVTDKAAFHQWCIDNGFEPQMSLPWQTVNSVMKEKLLSGEEVPECVSVYVKPTPVFTRDKSGLPQAGEEVK